jgi:hypothetical protein
MQHSVLSLMPQDNSKERSSFIISSIITLLIVVVSVSLILPL